MRQETEETRPTAGPLRLPSDATRLAPRITVIAALALPLLSVRRNRSCVRRPRFPVPASARARGAPTSAKVADTDFAPFMFSVHPPAPVHAPAHETKREPAPARAVSVSVVPFGKLAVQVLPQEIPPGALATVPMPLPRRETVTRLSSSNRAVTAFAESTVRLHAPVPEHAPLRPATTEPAVAAAVSVRDCPRLKNAEQVEPHA